MPAIDAHAHVLPQQASLAVQVMDCCGIERMVTLEWHDGFGDNLVEHMDQFDLHPGRFTVFGNVDWSQINDAGFGERAAAQVTQDATQGMAGLKVYKNLGLELCHSDGTLWRIDDGALDPIWSACGELGLPVLIHSADVACFWPPEEQWRELRGLLPGDKAWWSYYAGDAPSHATLIDQRNAMIARHPETIFICPHLGSHALNLQTAARDLDRLPNMVYDISACTPFVARTQRSADATRQFVTKYQDRLMFGSDWVYWLPSDTKQDSAEQQIAMVDEALDQMQSELALLSASGQQRGGISQRTSEPYALHGLGLPPAVLDKVLYQNTQTIIPSR